MDHFKFPSYTRDNVTLLRAYTENQIAYLRRLHPTLPVEQIRDFVIAEVQSSVKKPTLSIIGYPSYGNAKLETVDLLTYTDKIRKNVVTPAGVVYMPSVQKESFLKNKILSNGAARKKQKQVKLIAATAGDTITEQRAEYIQSQIKIETNSIPGAFGSAFNCLFDKPNYNAVTGLARHAIMCGYAHVEKMLEGNYYFPTLEHCINYCIQLVRHCPKDLASVISEYTIYVPSVTDVANHFTQSLRLYMRITPRIKVSLTRFLSSLTTTERSFVYYAYCLKSLLTKNEHLFRPFLEKFTRTNVVIDETVDPKEIFSFNSDLLAMVSGLNADIIHHKTVADAITEDPAGVRHLIAIGHHMQRMIDGIGRLIKAFLRVDCDVADAMAHPKMIRKAVIISDTDSVIFSTQSWVEWYTGGVSFGKEAYGINGFVVFLVIMTLEQVFARLSVNLGAGDADIHRISMKNEFLYPLMLRTPLPKQYVGRVAVQEGFVLAKQKKDTKGLSFKSSTMCRETTKAGDEFTDWLFDTIIRDGSTTVYECLEKVLNHELTVIRSLEAGERTFLKTATVRTEYKNDEASILFNWKFWEEVFRPNFGEFVIPNKGFDIPIMGDGRALSDERYLERVRLFDSSLYDRLLGFMERNQRKITRLIVPMTLKRIPAILRPIIDIRGIVYTNSTPFHVTMRSLGIGYTNSKEQTLLSDIYTTKDGAGCSTPSAGSLSSP